MIAVKITFIPQHDYGQQVGVNIEITSLGGLVPINEKLQEKRDKLQQ